MKKTIIIFFILFILVLPSIAQTTSDDVNSVDPDN